LIQIWIFYAKKIDLNIDLAGWLFGGNLNENFHVSGSLWF